MMVRIKPFNKNRKHLRRLHVDGVSGRKYEETRGWYKVADEAAIDRLREVRQIEGDENSPYVFDVETFAGAMAIDKSEEREFKKRSANNANEESGAPTRRRAEDVVDRPAPRAPRAIAREATREPAKAAPKTAVKAAPAKRGRPPRADRAPRSMVAE